MKKPNWILFFLFGFLLLLLLLVGYGYITEGKTEEKIINISVLVYGNDTERWTSLKQGAEQAEKDYHVIINFITTSEENSPEEQIEQINREIENGAQGLLIAACDSTKLEKTVAELIQKIPILMIETGDNNLETILSADNYKMGNTLAKTIRKEQTAIKKVAVITENMQRDSVVQRKKGVEDALKDYDRVDWISYGDLINSSDLKKLLSDQVDTIVALDNSTLEQLSDFIEEEKLNVSLYGIGNTDKVVYYLDKGVIHSIAFQDEFSVGYLGTQLLYQDITGANDLSLPEISFHVIDKNNMYSKENQRLLFPLVQ